VDILYTEDKPDPEVKGPSGVCYEGINIEEEPERSATRGSSNIESRKALWEARECCTDTDEVYMLVALKFGSFSQDQMGSIWTSAGVWR
jgi:hypothetical protein